ncbi:MAG TPA: type I-E CRISPR-associated endonuclease Cas1e [Candidatus Sumerlaeota bacterium]|nr:type I-E CRISPR-associated endonuclease Cas1e [Candidatus Sumerlaeota bacterium]
MNRTPINPQDLPRFSDKLSYLYVEHAVVDQEEHAIALYRQDGISLMPVAALGVLLLGPGTKVTHQAVHSLSENGCLVLWIGEHGVRYYAQGMGLARSARNLQRQASLASHPVTRLKVVVRMYCKRFKEPMDPGMTLQQLRGREGIRVREAYAHASAEYGVPWNGRSYKRDSWENADPVNRALSCANSCLYGLVHAAILCGGYSPGLGFIHCGKQLSFVYDIADLYKEHLTIPAAFRIAAESPLDIETRIRRTLRDVFRGEKLMERILPDIASVLGMGRNEQEQELEEYGEDAALPAEWWAPSGFSQETPIGQILEACVGD